MQYCSKVTSKKLAKEEKEKTGKKEKKKSGHKITEESLPPRSPLKICILINTFEDLHPYQQQLRVPAFCISPTLVPL